MMSVFIETQYIATRYNSSLRGLFWILNFRRSPVRSITLNADTTKIIVPKILNKEPTIQEKREISFILDVDGFMQSKLNQDEKLQSQMIVQKCQNDETLLHCNLRLT